MGAKREEMDAEHHDLVLAVTQAMPPHLIALYDGRGLADDWRAA